MFVYLLLLLFLSLATEAVVELVIKSEIFSPVRRQVFKLGGWFQKLFSCGYCFSVWVALAAVSVVPESILPVSNVFLVDTLLTVLIVHRLSNIMHNVIDKWTDKYYSIHYVNTDKN